MAEVVFDNVYLMTSLNTGQQENMIADDIIPADCKHFYVQNNIPWDVNVLLFKNANGTTQPVQFACHAGGSISVPYPVQSFQIWTAQTEPPTDAIPPAGVGGQYSGPGHAQKGAVGYVSVVAYDDQLSMFSSGDPITADAYLTGALPEGSNTIGGVNVMVGGQAVSESNPMPTDVTVQIAEVTLTGSNTSFAWETTASTTEETETGNVNQWFTFANDDPSNDIQINFDASVGSTGTMTIKAGDILNGMPRKFSVLHVKAVSGSPAFRAWGV